VKQEFRPLSYKSLSDGKYTLYDITSAQAVGSITLRNISPNESMIIDVDAQEVTGEHHDRTYDFPALRIGDIKFQREIFSYEDVYCASAEGHNFFIVNIFNQEIYPRPIPDNLYNTDSEFFLFTSIHDNYNSFLRKLDSPGPLHVRLVDEYSASRYSAIFSIPKNNDRK
jgi:hypothetical protein